MKRTHKRMSREQLLPHALAHGLGMLAVVLVLNASLVALWSGLLQQGIQLLGLQAQLQQVSLTLRMPLSALRIATDIQPISGSQVVVIILASLLVGAASLLLRDSLRPAGRLLRWLCLLQLLSVLWVWQEPWPFGYSLAQHTAALCTLTLATLYVLPLPLALGFAALGLPAKRAWQCGGVVLLVLAVLLPLQMLSHVLLVTHFSAAVMPLLFVAGGPLLLAFSLLAIFGYALARFTAPTASQKRARKAERAPLPHRQVAAESQG